MSTIKNKIEKIQKRDGRIVEFDPKKITNAIFKALTASGQGDGAKSKRLSNKVIQILNRRFKKDEIPQVEQIQDIVEEVLILEGYIETAKAYILYREQRRRIREATEVVDESSEKIDSYLQEVDWQISENANMTFSLQGLNQYVGSYISKKYWLNKIYPQEIREAAANEDFHIHNLELLAPYCAGWDLYDFLKRGFGGVTGKIECSPPKHLRTAMGQLVNVLYTLQGETAGANAVSNFDTLLAPFIRYDSLNFKQLKQVMQEFLYGCMVPTRVGFQTPFLNVSLDINPPNFLAKQPVIIGGQPQKETYGEFQTEMDMFVKAFYEGLMEGDAKGRPFSVDADCLCPIKNSGKIKLIKIGDYIDKMMEKRSPFYVAENNCQVLDIRNLDIKALGLKNGKIDWQKINYLVRHPLKNLLEIKTQGGFATKVTTSHSVLVLKNGEIKNYEARNLKEGDYLIMPKTIPQGENNIFKISLAEEFIKKEKQKEIYISNVFKNGELYQEKRVKKCNGKAYYVSVFPLANIKNDLNDYDLSHALLSLKGSPIKINNNLLVGTEMAEFLGWYCAEGSAEKNDKYGGISISFNLSKEKKIAYHVRSLVRKIFGNIPVKIREIKERNLIEVRIHSKLIRRIITEILEIKNGDKRKVPDIIFELSAKKKKIFLSSYFQGDAWITQDIIVNSISRQLIYGISTLLKQLNVFHTINKYIWNEKKRWRINVWGNKNLKPKGSNSISKIPIEESGLGEIIKKILEKEPYFHDLLNRKYRNSKSRIFQAFGIHRQKSASFEKIKKIIKTAEKLNIEVPPALKEIRKDNLLFLKINEIKKVASSNGLVYDFSTESENFVADQLLVHNTFPIPTVSITKDFDWDNPNLLPLWEATAKYGVNYFSNFIHSDMKPEDVRSMCLFPNEEIIIRNSKKIKRLTIKEVAENYKSKDFDKEGWADCKKGGGLEVLSLNPITFKTEWSSVKRFLKIFDKKTVEITTEDGKKAIFSIRHPIPIFTERGITMKWSKDIKKGDYLLSIKNAKNNLSKIHQQIDKNITLDEDLAKILGYFIADGNYLFENRKRYAHFGEPRGFQFTFKTGDKNNLDTIKNLIKKVFNLECKEKQDPRYNTYYLYVYNTELARKLYNAGFKKYGRLPQILFNSPSGVIKSFLEFHFKGDGYEKRKEIHINDLDLSRDLVLLYSLVGQPITYKLKKRSQRIYLQHAKSKIKKGKGWLNGPIISERIPAFFANGKKIPGFLKSRTIGFDTIDKYNANTPESLKLKNGEVCIVRVKSIKKKIFKELKEFYDLELEKNHLFLHSLGQISFNCCRLRLNNKELYMRGGGLFGSAPLTGSIGVVTINMPRIGYLSKTKKEFFNRLGHLMELAKESLEIKRKALENFIEKGLYPYSKHYLEGVKKMRSSYFGNHFSTIGLMGMNECLLNFLGENIGTSRGRRFSLEVLDFMRDKLIKFQEETGNLYNLEATPGEGTSYRQAKSDKEKYPDIITAGTKEVPYYTNSTHLPVNYTDDAFEALKLQDELQKKYTGGTVFHLFLGERISDPNAAKNLVKKIFEKFHLPYVTLTPTFSICPSHGYLAGEHFECPKCLVKQPCEVYSRVVGYLRPVQQWHKGKKQEFKERKEYELPVKA